MADARTIRTDKAVKNALLDLLHEKQLSEITVAVLCRKAGVSRSTFYGHYSNVMEVYEQLVRDFFSESRSLKTQLKCASCSELHPDGKVPYCIAVKTSERYASLVKEPQYLSTMLRTLSESSLMDESLKPYLDLGVKADIARDLLTFQMSGCHIVATSADTDTPWEERQRTLDTFIAGGMTAVRNMNGGSTR